MSCVMLLAVARGINLMYILQYYLLLTCHQSALFVYNARYCDLADAVLCHFIALQSKLLCNASPQYTFLSSCAHAEQKFTRCRSLWQDLGEHPYNCRWGSENRNFPSEALFLYVQLQNES